MWSRVEWGVRIAQTVFWVCLVLLGLLVVIPLAIVKSDFQGGCVMYSEAKWTVKGGKHWVYVIPGGAGRCNFVFGVSAVLCLVYGVIHAALNINAICKERRGEQTACPNCCHYLFPIINGCCTGLVMVCATMLALGLRMFCNQLMQKKDVLKSCSSAQYVIDWKVNPIQEGFNGSRFFNYTTFSVIAAWTCFLVLLLQTCFSIYLAMRKGCCRRREEESDKTNLANAASNPAVA